jgi:hypothetical protein
MVDSSLPMAILQVRELTTDVLPSIGANSEYLGFGYHGDFVTGWDPKFLQDAIKTCNKNGPIRISDCPLFEIIDRSKANQCAFKVPQGLANENVKGPRKLLPGGIRGEK